MRDLLRRRQPGRGRSGARRGLALQLHRHRLLQPQAARVQDRPRRRRAEAAARSAPRSRSAWATATPSRRRPPVSGIDHRDHDQLPGRRLARALRRRLRPRLPADDRQELAHLVQGARQRRGARDRELQQPRREDRDDEGEARADRAEPGKRLGVPEEARRPQSLRAVRRRAADAALRATRTTRRRRSCGSSTAKGLLSFKPEANLAGQISQVEVYGWDPQDEEADRRTATRRRRVRARPARAPAST